MSDSARIEFSVGAAADVPPLASTIGYLIRRGQQVHNALWTKRFEGQITSPQYAVLAALSRTPGTDQQALGARAFLDRSSIAEVVTRLVARGWIERHRNPHDGRHYALSLSPRAKTDLSELTSKARDVQLQLAEPLGGRDRKAAIRRLRMLARMELSLDSGSSEHIDVLGIDAPGHLIRRAQQIHTSIWSAEFGREITGPQYAAMVVLVHEGGVIQSRIGEVAALDRSTLADIAGRLEEKGWLTRALFAGDGRGRLVELTPAGRDIVAATSGRVADVQEQLLQPLSVSDRGELVHEMGLIAFR